MSKRSTHKKKKNNALSCALEESLIDVKNYASDTSKPNPGYHLREIEHARFGTAAKIREEAEEFADAVQQGVDIMALVELSDLIGAIEGYLEQRHPDFTIYDLIKMKDVTRRAFLSGQRT